MKKTAKTLAVLLAIVCVAMPLSACDTSKDVATATPAQVFDLAYTQAPDVHMTKYEEVEDINQYADTYTLEIAGENKDSSLVCLKGTPSVDDMDVEDILDAEAMEKRLNKRLVLVYNLNTNQIVFKREYKAKTVDTDEEDNTVKTTNVAVNVSFGYDEEGVSDSFFTVVTETRETSKFDEQTSVSTVLYDNDGKKLHTLPKATVVKNLNGCVFAFGQKLFKAEDGVVSFIMDVPAYNEFVAFEVFNNDFFYDIASKSVSVYDTAMNLIYHWDDNNILGANTILPLSNGNILVQRFTQLPEDAKEYDVLMGQEKFSFESLLLNPKEKTEEAVELNYIVSALIARNQIVYSGDNELDVNFDFINATINNVASIGYIVDKEFDFDSSCVVALGDELDVQLVLAPVACNSKTQDFLSNGNGYFTVNVAGQSYVFNESGEQTGVYNGDLTATHSFLVAEDAGIIYNYKLEEIYVCDEYTTIGYVGDTYVILVKSTLDKTEYIHFDGASKILFTHDKTESDFDYSEDFNYATYRCLYRYYIKTKIAYDHTTGETTKSYVYYDFNGKILCKNDTYLTSVVSSVSAVLLQDEEGNFHRISG